LKKVVPPDQAPNLPVESIDGPGSILVTGFDDETKEEELMAYFYKLVYGGGTRNINDGKVQSCHIISLPMSHQSNGDLYPTDIKLALISFENKLLADLAISNSLTTPFKGMPIFAELPNEHS